MLRAFADHVTKLVRFSKKGQPRYSTVFEFSRKSNVSLRLRYLPMAKLGETTNALPAERWCGSFGRA